MILFFEQLSFISFISFSSLSLILGCAYVSKDNNDRDANGLRFRSALVYFVSLALGLYFFIRHNKYCEPGVYSLFALAEYLVVLSNMAFHFAVFYDFKNTSLTVVL